MAIEALIRGIVSRILPAALPDNASQDGSKFRLGRYGDQYALSILDPKKVAADEGSYYVVTNPTPGTVIRPNAVVTAFSDTNGFFVFKNTDGPGNAGSKRIFLDYMRLILLGTPPTAAVSQQFAFKRSKTTDRFPTTPANMTSLPPVGIAGASGRGSIMKVASYAAAGAMTIPASAGSDEVLCRASIGTGIGIVGDEYVIKFGTDPGDSLQGLTAAKAVVPGRYVTHAPPIIIEPGECVVCHRWSLTEATNAPDFEFEVGWIER